MVNLHANARLAAIRPSPTKPQSVPLQRDGKPVSANFARTFTALAATPATAKTVTTPVSVQSASTNSGTPNTSQFGFNALVPKTVNVAGLHTPTPADPTPQSFDDTYWNSQPAAVQQLRNIDDPTQRDATARQLASQGYQIDVPIMDWGWDPEKTMALRQSYGYTWVPNGIQSPVTAAPGLSGPFTSYDPNNPPIGSIKVG